MTSSHSGTLQSRCCRSYWHRALTNHHLPPSNPLSAPFGQVLALGNQTVMNRAGQHRATGWCWEVQSVQEVGGGVVVTGRLTIPTADGDLHNYSAYASEPLESASKAPAAEVAASSYFRRAEALAVLDLELWG